MDKNIVSIITPTYNSGKFIGSTIDSIKSQTFRDWELLITDDCSTDETWALVRKAAELDSRIKPIRLAKNSGAAVSRNNSIQRANGRYLAFIDSDDVWVADKLEKQLDFMESNQFFFSFTAYCTMNEDGKEFNKVIDSDGPDKVEYTDMLCKKATMGCSTVMIDRGKIKEVRMPLLRTGQDYATWLAILKKGHLAYCLKEPLTKYRIVAGSISRNKFKKAMRQWEIYRKVEGIDLFSTLYYFVNYAARAVFR